MKKVFLSILVIILLGSIITMGVGFKLNKSDNVVIKTYVDGELASAPPASTDGYKVSNISCTNGASAKFNYSTWRLEVSGTTSNTTCTVEFTSNDNETFANYLISKACSGTPTSDDDAKNCLVNENGYRYEGKNPNNYVLFNDELWRVIGVFSMKTASGNTQNLVKLIRNDILDGLAWNSSGSNDWSSAKLQQTLNNGYLNAVDSSCNFYRYTKTCYFSETGINSTARNMIESVVWNLGGRADEAATADTFYTAERGTTVDSGRPTEWTGKVGLMYPSDYGYAVLASSCERTTNLGDYDSTACAGNNWLKSDSYQWTLTPSSSYSFYAFSVAGNGILYVRDRFYGNYGYGVRPSIYLKSNIAIMGGSGSYSDPYLLS